MFGLSCLRIFVRLRLLGWLIIRFMVFCLLCLIR